MPDTNSPKVHLAEEDFLAMLIGTDQELPRRKWTCPGDPTIAAYVDGMLGKLGTRWIEFHLSSCQRCRLLLGDVVKAQREADIPLPPVELMQRAVSLAKRRPAPRRWVWVPATATATIVLFAMATIVLHRPEQLKLLPPRAPSAPLIAKSEPAVAPRATIPEIIRKPRTAELMPSILSPTPGSVVAPKHLHFSWKPISHARDYAVRIVTSDGDLVWEGQTERSSLQFPPDVPLAEGSYFVWITATLADGRTVKSPPVRFLVKR
jgi:hypothetical protein